jgi:serine/threonine protein kinase
MHGEIGRGGFSTVWRATDDALGRQVAVKVLSTRSTDQTTAMRFERECRALGAVSGHPNIVTVHQVGTTSAGYPYLVMGYERGGSLAERIGAGPLTWSEAVDIGARIADALEVAHRAGVLHRDVKPGNILVGDYGAPKLTDFGIARLHGGPLTASSSITASMAHAPPEVLEGQAPDASADVYSLCSTVHMLVAGRPPFFDERDESILPLIARIATDPPPRFGSPVPERLNEVLTRGMAKSPAQRTRTAAELAAQLRDVGSDRPPLHITPASLADSTTSKAPVSARSGRRWLPAAGGAVAAVLLGAALIWVLVTDDDTGTGSAQQSIGAASTTPTSDGTTTAAGGEETSPSTPTASTAGTTDPVDPVSPQTDVGELSEVLIGSGDVAGSAITLEDSMVESSDDPAHPLVDYAYCGPPLDLTEIGAGANRVVTTNFFAPDEVIGSTVSVASSAGAAEAVIDEIMAAADGCDDLTQGLAKITVVDAGRSGERAEIVEVVSTGLTPDVELVVILQAVDDLVVTLEISTNRSTPEERERLFSLLVERAEALAA